MSNKIERAYGKEFPVGDIIYNKRDKTIYFIVKGGFFGIHKVILFKNEEGTYDMTKTYTDKEGQPAVVKIGKTFPVTKGDGSIVEGLTQGTLALGTKWDKDIKREVSNNNNALYFTTHKLRENKEIDENITQVGWVTGRFGIEIETKENTSPSSGSSDTEMPTPPEENPASDDEVPF